MDGASDRASVSTPSDLYARWRRRSPTDLGRPMDPRRCLKLWREREMGRMRGGLSLRDRDARVRSDVAVLHEHGGAVLDQPDPVRVVLVLHEAGLERRGLLRPEDARVGPCGGA